MEEEVVLFEIRKREFRFLALPPKLLSLTLELTTSEAGASTLSRFASFLSEF